MHCVFRLDVLTLKRISFSYHNASRYQQGMNYECICRILSWLWGLLEADNVDVNISRSNDKRNMNSSFFRSRGYCLHLQHAHCCRRTGFQGKLQTKALKSPDGPSVVIVDSKGSKGEMCLKVSVQEVQQRRQKTAFEKLCMWKILFSDW
jgi:hypothetical protein